MLKELSKRFDEIEEPANAEQVSRLEKALKKHSFKRVKEMPAPKGMEVPSSLRWYEDKEGFYVLIQEIEEEDYKISYQQACAPLVEDVLRN